MNQKTFTCPKCRKPSLSNFDTSDQKRRHENRLKRIYSRRAPRYNLTHSLFTLCVDRYWRGIAVKLVSHRVNTLLEIGTGSGLTSAKILNAGKAGLAVGLDLNLNMLRQSRKNKITQGIFIPLNANALRLPFRDNSFDAVVTMLGMGGIYSVEQAFHEILRVLKNNGLFYSIEMCTPRHGFSRFFHKRIMEKMVNWWWGFRDIDIEPIIRELKIADVRLKFRRDVFLGSVYQLEARVCK
jgi:ubiquinone/menaquinone biosynthesis C-methylase UbiE